MSFHETGMEAESILKILKADLDVICVGDPS
jgi:hypothetical protein